MVDRVGCLLFVFQQSPMLHFLAFEGSFMVLGFFPDANTESFDLRLGMGVGLGLGLRLGFEMELGAEIELGLSL